MTTRRVGRPLRWTRLVTACAVAGVAGAATAADDPSRSGAYCPFPKKGEEAACFTPVQDEYGGFIAAVDAGDLEGPAVTGLERDLEARSTGDSRYLAVSSLAYGYYQLASQLAAADDPDPALAARLDRWNELLATLYAEADEQPQFRAAVRDAANDLHERAPAVATQCADGETGSRCQTTGRLLSTLRQMEDASDERGVRGALNRLLGRILDEDSEAE